MRSLPYYFVNRPPALEAEISHMIKPQEHSHSPAASCRSAPAQPISNSDSQPFTSAFTLYFQHAYRAFPTLSSASSSHPHVVVRRILGFIYFIFLVLRTEFVHTTRTHYFLHTSSSSFGFIFATSKSKDREAILRTYGGQGP